MGAKLAGVVAAIGVGAAAIAGVAGLASAQPPAPVPAPLLLGSDGHGVRVEGRNGVRFVYTAAARARYAQIAGQKVLLSCDQVKALSAARLSDVGGGATTLRAPRRRAALVSPGGGDVCYVARLLGFDQPGGDLQVMAVVATTRRGALFLDQQDAVRAVAVADTLSAFPAELGLLTRLSDAVRLSSETATPPAHRLGIFLHGSHAYAAQRDRLGKLWFVRIDGDVTTTNGFGSYANPTLVGEGPFVGQIGTSG